MEKKEYKQPEIKVVEIGETCQGLEGMSQIPDDDASAKRGSLDFDNSFDTEE